MKKKILSLILAICLLIPCSFALTACGDKTEHECTFEITWTKDETYHWHKCADENCDKISGKEEHTWNDGVITTPATSSEKGIKTFTCTVCEQTKTEEVDYVPTKTMTEEQWTKALTFEGINNFSMVNTSPDDADYSGLYIIDGNKLYYKQIGGFGAGSDMEWSEDYYEVVGSGSDMKYYEYSRHSHNSTNWTRKEVDADYYNEMWPQNQFAFFQYNDFTYNETTGKYECESMNMGVFSITGIALAFENNRLVSVTMTALGETHNMVISYKATTLTIPTSFVNG